MTQFKTGGLIVNEREDGDVEIMNENRKSKIFISKPELKEITDKVIDP